MGTLLSPSSKVEGIGPKHIIELAINKLIGGKFFEKKNFKAKLVTWKL